LLTNIGLSLARAGQKNCETRLVALTKALATIPGAEGSTVMRDTIEPDCFIFLENWISVRAHDDGSARLPKDAISAVFEPLAGKPERRILEILR
jgi:hypothetical protein